MEGNLRIPYEIFSKGTLINAFTNSSSSKELGCINTASCFREDIKSYPTSVATSVEIERGNDSQIIESLNEVIPIRIMLIILKTISTNLFLDSIK